ncbi:MAG TPA: LuxR C-terminal-related transcriptional regulator [Gaiellaceae bacterium]|nr:LuxR C-terminal-related transcriptional regulator [Gaiellaceae bacterium]
MTGNAGPVAVEPGLVVFVVDSSGKLAEDLRDVLRRAEPVWTEGDRSPDLPAPAALLDVHLTPRELDVLRLVAARHTNSEIARDLWVSQETVRFHLRNAYRKLGVHTRADAVRRARISAAERG